MPRPGRVGLAGALVLVAAAAGAQPEDRWAVLRPLLGAWEGTSNGQPGRGTVHREYRWSWAIDSSRS